MKVWHIHVNHRSRAFANPKGLRQCFILFLRGWRQFNLHWWSKPSKNLARVLQD